MLDPPTGTAELRDPGLYPDVRLFVSNRLTNYVRVAPGRINALVSAQYLWESGKNQTEEATRNMPSAREAFLDSGVITPLLQVLNGREDAKGNIKGPEVVHNWLEVGHDTIVRMAWDMHDAGAALGVIAALDLPAYPDMLDAAKLSLEQAEEISIANAELMLEADVPHGWRRLFTTQGRSLEDHQRCMHAYAALGVLDEVRAGNAWLAVGGMAFEGVDERVWSVHRAMREQLGEGHIHALGVSRLNVLVPMIRQGWVNSADSSSPAQEVRYNRGPYRIRGPRPTFLADALFAANALLAEAELAKALEGDFEFHEQGSLL
jgi:hypothetical protein